MRIRIVPTASGKKAIQVVSKLYGKVTVHKHIGTFQSPEEKLKLLKRAQDFITETTGQISMLDVLSSFRPSEIKITQQRPTFLYQLLCRVYNKLGFSKYPDPLIRDLVVARLYKAASKRETREIIAEEFGKDWTLITIYRHLKIAMKEGVKDTFQKALIEFAKSGLNDNLRLIFYDVTTLYFESALREGIRDFGFSKDHHPQDTQVVVGLVVTRVGFPLYFDVFSGKTFEGNTFIPVIENIQSLLGTRKLTVVADSAMISKVNINKLDAKNINFIVGARVANLPTGLTDSITDGLDNQDNKIITKTYHGYRLVCQYSAKRAAKDGSDRLKQVAKAQNAITTPSFLTKRFKFIKTEGQRAYLNEALVTKAEKLEGIKGYLTNTNLPGQTVIDRYHDLWRIENSFRITKSDLEARPIFHRLDETIKAHLVIVFAGLAIAKYIEIQTNTSIHKALKLAGKILTQTVTNTTTGEAANVETTIEDPTLKEKIELLRSLGH